MEVRIIEVLLYILFLAEGPGSSSSYSFFLVDVSVNKMKKDLIYISQVTHVYILCTYNNYM